MAIPNIECILDSGSVGSILRKVWAVSYGMVRYNNTALQEKGRDLTDLRRWDCIDLRPRGMVFAHPSSAHASIPYPCGEHITIYIWDFTNLMTISVLLLWRCQRFSIQRLIMVPTRRGHSVPARAKEKKGKPPLRFLPSSSSSCVGWTIPTSTTTIKRLVVGLGLWLFTKKVWPIRNRLELKLQGRHRRLF